MDQIMFDLTMERRDRLILISMLLMSLLIVILCIYGLVAYFLIIPEKDSEIKSLEFRIEAYQGVLENKDAEIKELKNDLDKVSLKIRWSKFLNIMLDKDTRVRFDGVEKYLKKNRNGLYSSLTVNE